ncbi:MAG: hypothetical protein IPI14_12680 [Polaromonas sp.]|nr:hypothetical protein [Polaromonas sp.]
MRGQGQGLQERMKPTSGRQARQRCAARLNYANRRMRPARQADGEAMLNQIGSADNLKVGVVAWGVQVTALNEYYESFWPLAVLIA